MNNTNIENWREVIEIAYGHKYSFHRYLFDYEFIYRGRPFDDCDLDSVKRGVCQIGDMWCPPAKLATKQRCNRKGEPLLYLSSNKSTIPYELNTKLWDYIPIIEYKSVREIQPCAIIGFERLMKIEKMKNIISNHYINKNDTIIQIDKTFGQLFSQKKDCDLAHYKWFIEKYNLSKITEDFYDITIGISDFFLSKSVIGIVYPSVANNYEAVNFALNPLVVKDFLVPISVNIYQFIGSNSHRDATMRLVCSGEIKSDERIDWKDIDSILIQKFEK